MSRHVVRLMAEATTDVDDQLAGEVLAHLSDVIDALEEIEETDAAILQCDLHADLGSGRIEIDVAVDAEDGLAASVLGLSGIRAAIHAAGGSTPGWEHLIKTRNVEIDPSADELDDDDDCALV